MYQLGVGVPVVPKKALYYYEIAAKAGQRDSRSALGYLYEGDFDGIPHDIDLAKYWYKLAADQGDPFAAQRLLEIEP
jgi:TPR repeat protein